MIKRFFKCLRFYYHCVGLKLLFTVELPCFIAQTKESRTPGYSFFSDLVETMEEVQNAYIG